MDYSAIDGYAVSGSFDEQDWLTFSVDPTECDYNESFEDYDPFGQGFMIATCGQGTPSENDVGEYYIWVRRLDVWTQTTTYIPRRFQVFELDTCTGLQTYVEELNSTILPANITLNEGWNMFGYVCYESQDVEQLFESIEDEIVIEKK